MSFQKLLKVFLFPLVNILVAVFLSGVFLIAGQNVVQTFTVANITALNYLRPYQINYFWELNINGAALDKNKIRYYADYYEHLLKVFPGQRDAYSLLGYCYHYLNDDAKAIRFLKTAIGNYPDYFWNYYNLAVIYINESRYQEASELLQKALNLNMMATLKRIFTSRIVYLPLLGQDEKVAVEGVSGHLKETYKTSFFLARIVNQAAQHKAAQEALKNFHLELYAF